MAVYERIERSQLKARYYGLVMINRVSALQRNYCNITFVGYNCHVDLSRELNESFFRNRFNGRNLYVILRLYCISVNL